nr:photosystem I subunit IX [Corydalis platycarpa]UZM11224.1 photosystem I subunit IX [Corydalis platycarpa]
MFNARSKNISLRGSCAKYSMVRFFSRSIDRDQSFLPGCLDIPLFSF